MAQLPVQYGGKSARELDRRAQQTALASQALRDVEQFGMSKAEAAAMVSSQASEYARIVGRVQVDGPFRNEQARLESMRTAERERLKAWIAGQQQLVGLGFADTTNGGYPGALKDKLRRIGNERIDYRFAALLKVAAVMAWRRQGSK